MAIQWFKHAPWRLGVAHYVAIGSTGAAGSVEVGSATRAVLISADTTCTISIGQEAANPALTATTGTMVKATDDPQAYAVPPGGVVSYFGSGNLSITELSY